MGGKIMGEGVVVRNDLTICAINDVSRFLQTVYNNKELLLSCGKALFF